MVVPAAQREGEGSGRRGVVVKTERVGAPAGPRGAGRHGRRGKGRRGWDAEQARPGREGREGLGQFLGLG